MNHSYNDNVAALYGIPCAVILHGMVSARDGLSMDNSNIHNGRVWMKCSIEKLRTIYPYMSRSAITKALNTLVRDGLLLRSNFNESKMDRTPWYSVTETGYKLSNAQ